jgi:hypothetical protein
MKARIRDPRQASRIIYKKAALSALPASKAKTETDHEFLQPSLLFLMCLREGSNFALDESGITTTH